MSFYENIATYYDFIFPTNDQVLSFLQEAFPRNGKLLDIACATGNYSIALSKLGYSVKGIDLNPKMLEIAKKKEPKLSFNVQNMLDLNEEAEYEGIYCIGNSLVHLDNIREVATATSLMYKALKKDGVLVLQIINNDLILNKGIESLPTIKNNEIEFIRKYEIGDEYINFKTTLVINDKNINSEERLRILKHKELIEVLSFNGFSDIESYDGFSDKPFNINSSMALVIKAIKR